MTDKEESSNDLLTASQISFLLGAKKTFNKATLKRMMPGADENLLIESGMLRKTDLMAYVNGRVSGLDRAIRFLYSDNKLQFFLEEGYSGNYSGRKGYLNLNQVAFILNVSIQNVDGLIQSHTLKSRTMNDKNMVSYKDMDKYLFSKAGRYEFAIEFIQTENTYNFWKKNEIAFAKWKKRGTAEQQKGVKQK